MKIETSHGNITAPISVLLIMQSALEKAAEFERQKGHLSDHDYLSGFASEIKEKTNVRK